MSTAAATLTAAPAPHELVAQWAAELSDRFLERAAEVRSVVLALVAREHVLLLGPPGTAKSAIATTVADGLGWSRYEHLLGKTTHPDELFGPLDVSGLMERRHERCVEGYLPTAQVAFLDEVYKASSAILNSLLTMLNERKYDHGARRITVPLEVVIAASNEGPQDEGLAPLHDRFLVRHVVAPIQSDDSFAALLTLEDRPAPRLDRAALEAVRAAADAVDVRPVVPMVVAIRADLASHEITASDRRWRKAMGLVRAAAALAGRAVAAAADLAVLVDCLWERVEDRDQIRATVAKHRSPNLAAAEELLRQLRETVASVPASPTIQQYGDVRKANQRIEEIVKEAGRLAGEGDPEAAGTLGLVMSEGTAATARHAKSVAKGLSV